MDRTLNSLSDRFRPLAGQLLARLVEHGIMVTIVETLRTPEEHAANLASGHSWIQHSKHLDGDAIDICPFEQFELHGPDKLQWNADDPVWAEIGNIGESIPGIKWGGRWKQKDLGHFEFDTTPQPHIEASLMENV